MFWSLETHNKIWQSGLHEIFTHVRAIINQNAGYDDETVED